MKKKDEAKEEALKKKMEAIAKENDTTPAPVATADGSPGKWNYLDEFTKVNKINHTKDIIF